MIKIKKYCDNPNCEEEQEYLYSITMRLPGNDNTYEKKIELCYDCIQKAHILLNPVLRKK